MDHSYFRDKVSAYHDRELPAQELEMLREHIASCAECSQLLAEYERLDALVAAKIELQGSDEFWERSAQKIEERLGFIEKTEVTPISKPSWDRSMVWKMTAVAASVAIMFFIGLNKDDIFRQSIPDEPARHEIAPNIVADSATPAKEPTSTTAAESKPVEIKKAEPAPATGGDADQTARTNEIVTPLKPVQAPEVGEAKTKKVEVVEERETTKQVIQLSESSPTTSKLAAPGTAQSMEKATAPAEQPSALFAPAPKQAASERSLGMPDIAVDSISADSEADLAHWRSMRDSLIAIAEAPTQTAAEKYGITGYQRSEKSKKAAAASNLRSTDVKAQVEKQLLEANYQIALLTSDADEYASCIKALQRAADDVSSTNAPLAGQYLTRLKTERTSPPQK
ncbi:MAG: zf-HC2 domain-containing protein [candidate division Zixibacteria bacterium]|nr:zf-HC2 domain-containing protein [candidate division Zixibacteria bacterium]